MDNYESQFKRWLTAGVIDEDTALRIRNYELERKKPAGLRWQGLVALILGGILLASGVVLFVSAHWDQMGPGSRFCLVLAMVAAFHLSGAWVREKFRALSTTLHAVGTVATGAAIALVGQIFNIQEHWPAAILLWAIAALAGWTLLHDEAQQTLTFLLFPAWMLSEFSYYANYHIGGNVFIGRILIAWGILYLTFFLGSKRKALPIIFFTVGAVFFLEGIVCLLQGWRAWSSDQTFLPLETRLWGWTAFAVLPLFFSVFRLFKSMVPVAVAIGLSIALPWCMRIWTRNESWGTYVVSQPNIAAHALVAAFCVFMIWWGMRKTSRALVNLGIVGFAATVVWFYFSDILDKVGRSLGMIGLGILFLAGGWALEKARRGIVARMGKNELSSQEAE
jgi:uncharacterized membrane protein